MLSFTLCLLALIAGYFLYGRLMERLFGPDDRPTPALTKADGVDFIALPTWKIFMIQFLNIAGLGPIFGAIMGAKFGTASFLWIVLGSIFAGAVHDLHLHRARGLRHPRQCHGRRRHPLRHRRHPVVLPLVPEGRAPSAAALSRQRSTMRFPSRTAVRRCSPLRRFNASSSVPLRSAT